LDKSSRDSTGVSNLDTVKKAAKLAVYDAIIMNPKSHHVAATSLPDKFLGASPPPYKNTIKIVLYTNKQIFFSGKKRVPY